jgi:hypothetical protein
MTSDGSMMFYGIKGDDITPGHGIFARFCPKAQVASVIAAPLAGVAVYAWVFFQDTIILRDIH